jgi:CubicO group peptidase (beta-lactamase class C family)
MPVVRWIFTCLGAVPLLFGCGVSQPPQATQENQAAQASQALDVVLPQPPPVVNPVHNDLSAKLDTYSGVPFGGALTPGMIAAVVKGKHIVALGAAGYAKLSAEGNIPMTEDMIFNIGSNTKSMAATLLSILIEESPQLDWDTTLAAALPWATEPGKSYLQPAARRNVTLRQLVAHRSGIACSYELAGGTVNNQQFSHPDYPSDWKGKTHQQVLKEFLRGPVEGSPRGFLADCIDVIGDSHYENGNFTIVQAVIDQWSGMSFLDYAAQKLINPQGMNKTFLPTQAFFLAQSGSISGTATQEAYWNPYFFQPTHPYLSAGKYVWGHNSLGTPYSVNDPDLDPWGLSPASGGFAFNIVDWARYAILHLRDTSDAIQNVHVPSFSGYSYGWSNSPRTTAGGIPYTSLCHTGSLTGMQSKICLYPELDIAYLSFANGGPDAGQANENVVSWMASQPAYVRDTGGCKDDPNLVTGVQRFWDSEMFGCAGSVTFPDRAQLCKTGYHACSAQEFVEKNTYGSVNAEAPKHHYWTNDDLKYGGSSSGSCWAATTGTSCGANSPMRVCAPGGVDQEGNQCNWVSCGYGSGSTTSRYFGGCSGNTTAGTLCCKD